MFSLSFEVLGVLSYNIRGLGIHFFETSLSTIPFLLIYVLYTINYPFKKAVFLILLPGVLMNIVYPNIDRIGFAILLEYFFNISLLLIILLLLNGHRKKLQEFYSDLEFKSLRWMSAIAYAFLGFHVFWIAEDIFSFGNDDLINYFAFVSTVFTLFLILWMGHFGFSQNEIFKQKLFVYRPEIKQKSERNEKITISGELDRINQQILEERLFVDPKLNLRNLSQQLSIPEKDLSTIINQEAKTNFYNYINQFRVKEFKRLLQTPKAQQYSILGLAKEAGFNSKSTFYAAFKGIEGMTPKEYQLANKAG